MPPSAALAIERDTRQEQLTSNEAYQLIMSELAPLVGEDSARRADFYGRMGVQVVELEPSRQDMRGHRSFISDQTKQPSGAYKSRGMTNAALAAFAQAEQAGDAISVFHIASAGNAGLGLTIAAHRLGAETEVDYAMGVSRTKAGQLLKHGARLRTGHGSLEEAMEAAELAGMEPGHVTIHPFDQAEVIAGQATVGLETLADLLAQQARGEIDLHKDQVKLFVPVGGGGLIAGIACVFKWAKDQGLIGRDNVQVIGVQMEGGDAMKRYTDYVRAGLTPPDDLFAEGLAFNGKSDGTAVRQPGRLTSAVIVDPEFVTDIVLVSEGELGQAMQDLSRVHGKPVEPAGALSMAGAKKYAWEHPAVDRRYPDRKETLITFTTGAQVDQELFDDLSERARERRTYLEQQREDVAAQYVGTLHDLVPSHQTPWLSTFRGRVGTRVGHAPVDRAP